MRSLLAFVVLAIAAIAGAQAVEVATPSFQDKIRPIAENCKKEDVKGATNDDVDAVVNRNELTTPEAKCLQSCVYVTIGALKNDILVPYDEGLKIYNKLYENDPEILKGATEIVRKCTDYANDYKMKQDEKNKEDVESEETKQNNLCDLAAAVQECFRGK